MSAAPSGARGPTGRRHSTAPASPTRGCDSTTSRCRRTTTRPRRCASAATHPATASPQLRRGSRRSPPACRAPPRSRRPPSAARDAAADPRAGDAGLGPQHDLSIPVHSAPRRCLAGDPGLDPGRAPGGTNARLRCAARPPDQETARRGPPRDPRRALILGHFWQFEGVNGVAIISSTGKVIAEDMPQQHSRHPAAFTCARGPHRPHPWLQRVRRGDRPRANVRNVMVGWGDLAVSPSHRPRPRGHPDANHGSRQQAMRPSLTVR